MINKLYTFIIILIILLLSILISFVLTKINYSNIIKKVTKMFSKFDLFFKINKVIIDINNIKYSSKIFLNSYIILIFSIILCFCSFIFFIVKFKILISSIFILIISLFTPLTILEIIDISLKEKLKNQMYMFIVNMQSYSKNTNDIILTINNINCNLLIKNHIEEFKLLISKGYDVINAFDILDKKLNIKEFSLLFNLLKQCYITGGDLNKILKKFVDYYKEINKIKNKQRERRIEVYSILIFLLIINFILVFCFCLQNTEYRDILLNTLIGKIIFNLNMFFYLFIFMFIRKILKKE